MGNNTSAGEKVGGGIFLGVGAVFLTIASGGTLGPVALGLVTSAGTSAAAVGVGLLTGEEISAGASYQDGELRPYIGCRKTVQIINDNIQTHNENKRAQEQMKKEIEKKEKEEFNRKLQASVAKAPVAKAPVAKAPVAKALVAKVPVATTAPKIMTMNDVENAILKYKLDFNRIFVKEMLKYKIKTKGLTKADLDKEIKIIEKSEHFIKEASIIKEASKLTTAQRISNVEHTVNVGQVALAGNKSGISGLAVSAAMHPIQHYNETNRPRTSTENNIKAGASLVATLTTNPYVGTFITSSLIASELREATKHLEDSIAKKVVTVGVMREFERKYNKKITKAELKREVEKELKIFEKIRHTNDMMMD